MDVTFGIDIASYQANLSLLSVHSEGFAFVYTKATQGVSYIDPCYAGWAENPGSLIFVPYHYVTTDPPAAQAAFCQRIVGHVPAVMLDVEHGAPTSGAGILAVIEAFAARFAGVDMYLPRWYWEQIGSPNMTGWPIRNLIASDYPTTAPGYSSALYPGDGYKGWAPYGGRTPSILQFTDAAKVGGQLVDGNAAKPTARFDTATPTTPPPPVPAGPPPGPAGWAATVATVQTQLNRWPFSATLAVDGVAGPATDTAVRAYQHAAGITVDGVAGPQTLRRLTAWYDPNRPPLRLGATGPAVGWLQQELNRTITAALAVDGKFGARTLTAVERFQQERGLATDGVVGRLTNAAVQI